MDGVHPHRGIGNADSLTFPPHTLLPTQTIAAVVQATAAIGNTQQDEYSADVLKLADNPPTSPVAHLGESVFDRQPAESAAWAALYTKPRQEKALAADLHKLGIDYFLPLVKKVTMSGGRKRSGLYPLFASYLFASLAEPHRLQVLRTERIVQTISPEPPQIDTFVAELRAIEAAVMHCPEQIELQPRVTAGARARITGGSMKGTEGVVVKSDKRTKIWLQVTTLGTGVLVEIDADLLESTD